MKKNLLGNAAIAWGAINAGVRFVSGYPGTPSTEILETIAGESPANVRVEWSTNEKAAVEVAAGAAYSGYRTLVTMKQVGLNVASDPVMCLSYIGIKGGMVIAVADDPGPISSQTEQDTRLFGAYAHLTVLDPSSPEEAYAMTKYAFELSEKLSRPVILRPTTKVCHASATVEIDDKPDTLKTPEGFIKDPKWVIFPPLSFKKHSENFKVYNEMQDEDCAYNSVQSVPDSKYGIATGGVTSAIVADVLADMNVIVNRLIVGRPYPFPVSAAKKFAATSEKILVLEELEPFIEDNLARHTGYGSIIGKYTKDVPAAGELKYENVRIIIERFLGIETAAQSPTSGGHAASGLASGGGNSGGNSGGNLSGDDFSELQLPVRAPVLCAGCPHRASFYAVKLAAAERLKNSANALSDEAVYCGDIGCYTLGNAKPLSVTDTCLCMGAGITLAQGIAAMNPARDVFAFIGDSTFFASGMTGVANAVYNKHNITIIILDNRTTAMTGGQPHPGTGRTMMNETSTPIDIAGVLRALGVPHIAEADPLDLKIAIETVKTAADFKGVSAVVFKSPCIAVAKKTCTYEVNDCIGCKRCINEIGCPAISLKENKAVIDPVMCFGCGICEFVCKPGKIRKAEDNI